MTLIIPNTFANKTGTAPLKDLDENFTYLLNNIAPTIGSGGVLDGGNPTTTYIKNPNIDCGWIT
jgi:hypothetical protein